MAVISGEREIGYGVAASLITIPAPVQQGISSAYIFAAIAGCSPSLRRPHVGVVQRPHLIGPKGTRNSVPPVSPSATPSARKPSQLPRGLVSWCWIYDIKPRAPCPENTDPRAPEIQRPVGRVRMQRSDARAQRRMGARVRG